MDKLVFQDKSTWVNLAVAESQGLSHHPGQWAGQARGQPEQPQASGTPIGMGQGQAKTPVHECDLI